MHVRAFMHLCKICAWKCPWYANDSKCIVAYYDIWEVNSALIIFYFYFLYKSSSTNILRIFHRKNERRKVIDKIREKRKMTLQRWPKISMTKKRILEQWTRCFEWLSSSHVFQIILCNNLLKLDIWQENLIFGIVCYLIWLPCADIDKLTFW